MEPIAATVGEVIEVIEDAPDGERSVGRLRLIAAVLSIVGAAYVVFATRAAPLSLVLVAAVIAASLFWWRSFASVERAHAAGRRRRLVLGATGLAVEGDEPAEVAWSRVLRVELDHDRLRVEVVHAEGTLSIDPPIGGLGLEALGERVFRAHLRALSKRDVAAHNSSPAPGEPRS